ncbi:conserved hypothetical protein [Hyphomicrobiales bacterium]|jgi:hypothetical protein|nr:conserved hypothetical protein [Hyphomicrobiales bacterium]CAH1702637.1 conserved hypothetical protein [Hyphomicrobiales bacterium]CAI0346826.1 conserved hypothetical protein [Hyphomicrobiales bacterium]
MAEDRFVIADENSSLWGHLFGPGTNETMTRFVFDREENAIAAAEHQAGGAWLPMTEEMLANFHDHLTNANPDALADPAAWDLRTSPELPDWVEAPTSAPAGP